MYVSPKFFILAPQLRLDPAASISEEPPAEFDVAPLQYEKSIPPAMRREAVTHFAKHLTRGLFSDFGRMRASDERPRWKTFGVSSTATRQHRCVLVRRSFTLESQLTLHFSLVMFIPTPIVEQTPAST